jgi:tetratricopeptide (TPR) repeat protein
VSPNSPELLEFSKNVSGLARSNSRAGMNKNMEFALWLLEGIRSAGVSRTDDFSSEAQAQFPVQTLAYRSGNNTDIGLLYAGSLVASGIPAAYIPLEDDFIVACNLQTNEATAQQLFNGMQKVLQIDDDIWLPVSMNAINEGFMQAWDRAVNVLDRCFANNQDLDFIPLEDAWLSFPPAPLPAQDWQFSGAAERDLIHQVNAAFQQYINRDLMPGLRQIQAQVSSSPSAAAYNRLGIMLVRVGRTGEAKTAYERAANMGSVSAMINRASLAMSEKDYVSAEYWYKSALNRERDNGPAMRGLERASAYLER